MGLSRRVAQASTAHDGFRYGVRAALESATSLWQHLLGLGYHKRRHLVTFCLYVTHLSLPAQLSGCSKRQDIAH